MDKDELLYGSYDGDPTAYRSGGWAWSYIDGNWREADAIDVFMNMRVMSEDAFNERYPGVPAPPDKTKAAGEEDEGAPADTEDKFLPRRR
jgi:hypothetical protein